MSYMDIWAKPQRRVVRKTGNVSLPKRVKDWPTEARADFKYVKNELWKWAKAKPNRDRSRLALIAYEAVRGTYEGKFDQPEVIICKTEEEVWSRILSLKSQT